MDVRKRSRSRSRNRQRNRYYAPLIEEIEKDSVPATMFSIQLAHGSDMKTIPAFDSLPDLYKTIKEIFPAEATVDILYCTINSPKVDMDHLLSSSLGLGDVIYVHLVGETTTKKFIKTEKYRNPLFYSNLTVLDYSNLGLTITDNGAGRAFIKRIRDGSIGEREELSVGQQIYRINGEDMQGSRHYDVARVLRNIEEGQEVSLELISPLQSGFSFIAPRTNVKAPTKTVENGGMTLRLKTTGASVLQTAPPDATLLKGINVIFENYLGVNDDQLALLVAEMAMASQSFTELGDKVKNSELAVFQLPDEFIFDIWGVLSDIRRTEVVPQ
uniref:Gipc-1 n=1 Tax=Pristionchus pacificus TaxID=54126 RepID=A0A2A6BAH3_PRIPA|eukprot:PDM62880.1 gipc-1 [Pristionchus pacificus]